MIARHLGSAIAVLGLSTVLACADPARSAEVSFLTTQKSGEWLAARLSGTKVLNGSGEIIGEVSDVVLDANGQAQAIVVSVGGFLGLGAKEVAVPYAAVRIGDVVEGSRVVLLDVSREQLQRAPEYRATDPTEADRLKNTAAEWARIAKERALELGKQASEKAQEWRQKMSTPEPERQQPKQ